MTPKMTSKMTSGTPSKPLWSNPSPEGLGKGPGGPNGYKTTEKPPPEPVGQEGRKARHWCSVDRLSLPAYFDASFGEMLYIHINTCNIFVIAMHSSIAINLQCACNGLVKLNKNDRSRFVTSTRATIQKMVVLRNSCIVCPTLSLLVIVNQVIALHFDGFLQTPKRKQ